MDKDYAELFAERLAFLRTQKGVSARDMSLSIGQSAGYINNLENKNNLPSMAAFFFICDYLNISPMDFFNFETPNPEKMNDIISDLKVLSPKQLDSIAAVVKEMIK